VGSEPYHHPVRARITVGSNYRSSCEASGGGGTAWPSVFFMDSLIHLVVHEGHVTSDVFSVMGPPALQRLTGDGGSPSCLRVVLDVLVCMLADRPPPHLGNPRTEAAWQRHVRAQQDRNRMVLEYTPIAPSLFPTECTVDGVGVVDWSDVLVPELHEALASLKSGDSAPMRAMMREELPGLVFSFPMFSVPFCEMLLEEVEAYEGSGMPVQRPNSMNNYGLILNQVGMEHWMSALQLAVTQPISELLFPEEGAHLDGHHSFTVRYTAGEDLGLDMHTDDSDVTFNICLGKPGFTAAGLTFCGMMAKHDHRRFKLKYKHEIGRCVCHLGRQRHGADDIADGCRVNLIMWNRSTAFRQRRAKQRNDYEIESAPPSEVCLSFTHDVDYAEYLPVTSKIKGHMSRAWCPPPGKAHVQPDYKEAAVVEGYFTDPQAAADEE